MSQQLHPSTEAIRADQLPETWISAVACAIREGGHKVRALGSNQIEVYSERTESWHSLAPVFTSAIERDTVLARFQ